MTAGQGPAPEDGRKTSSGNETVQRLVAECLERAESEGMYAIEDVCARYPEHATSIRRRIESLAEMGLLPFQGDEQAGKFPERLGEFRLLRRLGGGGMGVVFLAEQEQLGRQVALKLIRPEHLYFPGARERFRREVEVVARLEHPSIVQIYTVGEEKGLPYFAMERIAGASLAEVLHELLGAAPAELSGADLLRALRARVPDAGGSDGAAAGPLFAGNWVECCFRIARDIAEALDHAHSRGVLHRDIKPSNVMLTAQGRVLLLDFGLATTEGGSRLTRTGFQMGSLPYMAPEQVNGDADRIGPATDVYGLGVLLYEMLTLRPPHAAKSREVLVEQITRGDPEPLRRSNGSVPRDAETVVLTALDADPARRYPGAREFARDLRNVLELRPIQARRASPLLRTVRFAQRRPATSLAIVFGALLVVGGPTFYALNQRQAKQREQRLRAHAETNFQRALAAVDQMLTDTGGTVLADVPQMEQVRRRLLQRALAFFQEVLGERGDDASLRGEAADAYLRVGRLQSELGDRAAARAALDQAIRLYDGLAAEDPADPRLAASRANCRHGRAQVLRDDGDFAGAEAELRGALEELARAELRSEPAGGLVEARATLHHALAGVVQVDGAGVGESERLLKSALDALTDQVRFRPADLVLREMLARMWNDLGLLLMGAAEEVSPRADDALAAFRTALGVLAEAPPEAAPSADRTALEATLRMNVAGLYRRMERYGEAEAEYRLARGPLEELARQFPDTFQRQLEVAHIRDNLGLLADRGGRAEEAREEYRAALEVLGALDRRYPDTPDLKKKLAIAHMNIAVTFKQGDRERELSELGFAVAAARAAGELSPSDADPERLLETLYRARIDALIALGRHAEAVGEAETYATLQATDWETAMNGALRVMKAAAAAERDEVLSESERSRIVEDYRGRAVALLRTGIERGFDRGVAALRRNELLPLAGREDYEALLREYEAR